MMCLWIFETWQMVRRKVAGPGRHLLLIPAITLALWAPLFGIGLYQFNKFKTAEVCVPEGTLSYADVMQWQSAALRVQALVRLCCLSTCSLSGSECTSVCGKQQASLLRTLARHVRSR
jgi:hypothetical protein